MLAKFGITSPFNKRKVKEQMLQKHQQTQFQHQHQAQQIQQHHVSSIPTPKKLTFSTNSALPVYQTALNGSSLTNTATNCNTELVYQSQISRFKQNNQQMCPNSYVSNNSSSSGISSNKTTSTSSRASSPTVSNYGVEPNNSTNSATINQEMTHNTTSTATTKTGSKLAQIFQQNSSKLIRKSSLSKPSVPLSASNNGNNTMTGKMGIALPQSTQFHNIQQAQPQQQQSSIPAVNNKIPTSSKLQAPGTISLSSQQANNNCTSTTSDTSKKTVK